MVCLAGTNVWVYNSKQRVRELQTRTESLEKKITEANVKLDSVVEFTYKTKDLGLKIDELTSFITKLQKRVNETSDQQSKDRKVINQISRGGLVMRATAYDLTVESCGKRRGHPEYGITRSGTRATKGRTVAVDPDTIPLGSKLYIKFPEKYRRLDGTYLAEDTGSAVKGDIIDIFLGEEEDEVDIFGIQKVTVYVTRKGWPRKE
jgi:3D (Asp-Asp-Asp) domain-containing protein